MSHSPKKKARRGNHQGTAASDGVQPQLVLDELVDVSKIKAVIAQSNTPMDAKKHLIHMDRQQHMGVLEVSYSASERTPGIGRLYANTGAQFLPRLIRNYLYGDTYHDIDMKNAQATIMVQEALRLSPDCGVRITILRKYVERRDELLQKLIDHYRLSDPAYGKEARDVAKEMVIAAINMGNPLSKVLDSTIHEEYLITTLKEAAKSIRDILVSSGNPEVMKVKEICKANYEKENPPPPDTCTDEVAMAHHNGWTRSFMATYFQHLEAQIMAIAVAEFKSLGLEVGALIFDGCLIKRMPADSATLAQAMLHVQDVIKTKTTIRDPTDVTRRMPGYSVTFVEKSMGYTWNEKSSLFSGKTNIIPGISPDAVLIEQLTVVTAQRRLKRRKEFVMEPHPTIRGAYVKYMKYPEFLNSVLSHSAVYNSAPKVTKKLIEWCEMTDHPFFQILTDTEEDFHKRILMRDGWWDIHIPWKFHPYTRETRDACISVCGDIPTTRIGEVWEAETPVSEHILDWSFADILDRRNVAQMVSGEYDTTPLMNPILRQFAYNRTVDPATSVYTDTRQERSRLNILEVMLGRMFYPIGEYDGWSCYPLICGASGIGKSTLVKVLRAMFPVGSISEINTNCQFGAVAESASSLAVIVSDASVLLHNTRSGAFPPDQWRQMLDGGTVQLRVLFKNGFTMEWRVPILVCANNSPFIDNISGRTSRRTTYFECHKVKMPATPIGDLDFQIISQELGLLMFRWISAYQNAVLQCTDGPGRVFASKAIDTLDDYGFIAECRNRYASSISTLWAWFEQGGDDYVSIQRVKGFVTSLQDLKMKFELFHKHKHSTANFEELWEGHEAILSQAGYTVRRVEICTLCRDARPLTLKPSCLAECAENHRGTPAIRSRIECVIDMRLSRVVDALPQTPVVDANGYLEFEHY